jgi:hypothetical protein
MPKMIGLNSENAAHRVAVLWDEGGARREGVFISRRDTDSKLNLLLGDASFPVSITNRRSMSLTPNPG